MVQGFIDIGTRNMNCFTEQVGIVLEVARVLAEQDAFGSISALH